MNLSDPLLLDVLKRTIELGLACAAISGVLGLGLSWLVTRTNLPGARWLSSGLTVPYALPPFLLAMAWVVLGNPTVGLLKDYLPEGGAYGFWGVALVLSCVSFAYPYFELRAGFEKLDASLEEAARISGAGPIRTFTSVSFPLLWPALLNGMILSFLFAVSAFGVPALLGSPARLLFLTTLIYSQMKTGGMAGLQQAMATSTILLGMAIVLLVFSALLMKWQKNRLGPVVSGKASRPSRTDLGLLKGPAALLAWGVFALAVILPWGALGISALAPVAGNYDPSAWTASHLVSVLKMGDFQEALWNSLLLTFGVATGIVALGFLLAFVAERGRSGFFKFLAKLVIDVLQLPFALPGSIIALALIYWVRADAILLLMALAYALKFAAMGPRSILNAFRQVHPSLEEAARISGAGRIRILWDIWLPLLRRSLGAAWLLAALPMFTELTMSVLLTGPGGATLGTVLFQLQEYANQSAAAALAWMMLTVALVLAWLTRPKNEVTS